jgi:hypothetical protein
MIKKLIHRQFYFTPKHAVDRHGKMHVWLVDWRSSSPSGIRANEIYGWFWEEISPGLSLNNL